ncbi:MAG TPA: MFS transporter [Chondromyces sp.]|nr:MFS transporter [Chondromyces sp.]
MDARRTKQFPLLILMANMLIAMTGIGLIIPIMPTIIQEFNAGGQVFGLLIATFAFAQFLFSPLAGDLSDRLGRKKTIIAGLFLFSASQLIFAFAQDLWMLFVSRLLGGTGAAFMIPSMMAYVADVTAPEDRAKGMGRLGASMSLGFVIGPGIGGFLAEFGLRAPFLIAAAVSAVSGIISLLVLPETRKEPAGETGVPMQKRENLIKQLIRSTKTHYFTLLIMMFTLSFGLANFQSTISLFVDIKFGFTPKDISFLMVTGGLVGVIIQAFVLDWMLRKYGEIRVMNATLFISAAAMFTILFTIGFWSIMAVSAIFFISTSLLRPSINTMVSKMAGDEQGFAAGMINAYMSIGNMIGPAIAGALFDINMGFPYIFGSFIILVCLFISIWWSRNRAIQVEGH